MRRKTGASVQDMSASPEVFAVYQKLLANGELTVRVYGLQPLSEWGRLARAGIRAGFGNDKLKIGGLKGFADGSLGSTTALFFEPYLDEPKTSGLPSDEMFPEGKMLDNILGADRAGLQVAVHAIGDKANKTILDMFAEVGKRNGARPPAPHRTRATSAARRDQAIRRRARDRFDAALSRD